jgi:hypothetical protein
MGLKDDLSQVVGLYKCDRCNRKRFIEELVEDEAMPGLLVCPECFEREGFDIQAARERKTAPHYFRT